MHSHLTTPTANTPTKVTRIAALKEHNTQRQSPAEIIEINLERIESAHPALAGLMAARAEGALQAMCSLGLIDGDIYLKAGREAYEMGQRRRDHNLVGVAK